MTICNLLSRVDKYISMYIASISRDTNTTTTAMMNRVIFASLLLMLMTSVSADGLLSSLGDHETVEQKERKGVIVMDRSDMQELKQRALAGAEVSDYSTLHISLEI